MRLGALALLSLTLGSAAPSSAASAPAGVPHLKGTHYCGRIYKADRYTLYTFARDVSCAYANNYAHRCTTSSSLEGWHLAGSGARGIILRRNRATLDFQSAGGSPTCLTDALS